MFWGRTSVVYKTVYVHNPSASSIPSMAIPIPLINDFVEEIAVEHLKAGSVRAVPTDTVYGLACDATNFSAINKLYAIKCRREDKTLAICLSDTIDIQSWAVIEHLPKNLIETLLPGPVTVILKSDNSSLDKSLCYHGIVGIRIPDYSFIRYTTRRLSRPLGLTSANLSNNPSALEVSEFSLIWDKISVIFDGGKLDCIKRASTIIDLSEVGKFQIVRKGAGYRETINVLNSFNIKQVY